MESRSLDPVTKQLMKLQIFSLMILFFFCSCATKKNDKVSPCGLNILEVYPEKKTYLTRQNLIQLCKVYELSPIVFNKNILIVNKVESDSSNAIRLKSTYAEKPNLLMSEFINLQLQWWINRRPLQLSDVDKEQVILYLQLKTLIHFQGKSKSLKIMETMKTQDKILNQKIMQIAKGEKRLQKIISINGLLPNFLKAYEKTIIFTGK